VRARRVGPVREVAVEPEEGVEVEAEELPRAEAPRPTERRPVATRERPAQRGGRRGRAYEAGEPAAPIVAFGDHVPKFMLRPVPIAARPAKAEAEVTAKAG
jgi:hypothetical protein